MFEIYDKTGTQRDAEWMRRTYGNIEFLDAGAGAKFRLVRVDETEGPAVLKARVLNAQGNPHASQPVALYWPDPSLPFLGNAGLKTLWRDRAIHQNTDGAGFTGFGLGTGSYIGNLAEGGPHVVWVLSPSLPSDGISGLGMLGGTNHAGMLFLTFQIVGAGTPEPPQPPTPEPVDDLALLVSLCVPQMAGTRSPATIASRAWDVLASLKELDNAE